jgi:hypothetical protein
MGPAGNLAVMYREHFQKRPDAGLAYNLDDHLWQAYPLQMHGAAVHAMSQASGLPQIYVSSLRAALNIT